MIEKLDTTAMNLMMMGLFGLSNLINGLSLIVESSIMKEMKNLILVCMIMFSSLLTKVKS